MHIVVMTGRRRSRSAGGMAESDEAGGDVVEHLDRLHLHVADDPGDLVVGAGGEGEAVLVEDARRVELDGGVPIEHEGDPRQREALHAGQVVAGVEHALGRDRTVHRHPVPERLAQRLVRRWRQPRDGGACVEHCAGGEDGGGHGELLAGNGDGLEAYHVKGRREGGDVEHGSQHVSPCCHPWHAEDEEAHAGGRREAVGEDAAVGCRRLRHQRLRAAA